MAMLSPGSVLLVTGATGGIGLEIAAQAAAEGATVAVHGSREETVAAAIEKLKARTPDARLIAVPGDFCDPDALDAVVARVVAEAGRLDAVVHCAIAGAADTTGVFRKTNPRNFGLLAQNVLGIFEHLCFAALPHLAVQGGTIVTFASDSGRFAAPRQSTLGGVFGGIMAFVRNLSMEVSRDKVRVHCISPSYVADTPVFDRHAAALGRGTSASDRAGLGLPTPKDIAPMVLFLCGPGAARITGQIISINGGLNA
ncbi:SDR family NAD(P)-dependent oxidoreductase [Sphingomonas solaris]|uniref:SDR family oxidoreductase n=1 Tax=Alterirhizorhabdus solaris TaxID=2529389 RepID=A0A558RBT2_9SPHN|nr:SDR family oxidoreductase [Sphingomonas solaris]TVV76722.1 SDR family oxidoreductase [Sphingomonas solaris]